MPVWVVIGNHYSSLGRAINRDVLKTLKHHLTSRRQLPSTPSKLKYVSVEFLPANTTSLIQLSDEGIFNAFKAHYRYTMRGKILQAIDATLLGENSSCSANELMRKMRMLAAFHMAASA